ncbi:MAG: deoxyribonuclease IV [Actinobacteria bacterium]|nr:deoxyribonuclease IV [Actinomycetota bacterium]
MIIGAHVPGERPLEEADAIGAECVQLFIGPPQSWKKPPPRADAAELLSAGVPIYVHAPYLINVASPNNRVRIPSRKILAGALERAEDIGAAGLIVHAGHAEDDIARGFIRWRKVFEELDSEVLILIENTAGGENAMGRHVDVLAELFGHLADFDVGFCFDTCHAHAAGEDLSNVVERVLAATGRIDLLHANDSRDPPGTGADRHANFSAGNIAPTDLIAMVKASGAPAVICETPWPEIADDLAWLRAELDASMDGS